MKPKTLPLILIGLLLSVIPFVILSGEEEQKASVSKPVIVKKEKKELDPEKIEKWILFYTNLERIAAGKKSLVRDPVLTAASRWQAAYCAKIQDLSHRSTVDGMGGMRDRLKHFGYPHGTASENLGLDYPADMNEQELARDTVKVWMFSSTRFHGILGDHTYLGVGVKKGAYRGNECYYVCQVFLNHRSYRYRQLIRKLKQDERLKDLDVKIRKGKEKSYTLLYSGPFEVKVVEAFRGEPLIDQQVQKMGNEYHFRITGTPRGWIVLVLRDPKNDILYPIERFY